MKIKDGDKYLHIDMISIYCGVLHAACSESGGALSRTHQKINIYSE